MLWNLHDLIDFMGGNVYVWRKIRLHCDKSLSSKGSNIPSQIIVLPYYLNVYEQKHGNSCSELIRAWSECCLKQHSWMVEQSRTQHIFTMKAWKDEFYSACQLLFSSNSITVTVFHHSPSIVLFFFFYPHTHTRLSWVYAVHKSKHILPCEDGAWGDLNLNLSGC